MSDNKPLIIVLVISILVIIGLILFLIFSTNQVKPIAQEEIAIPPPSTEAVLESRPLAVVEEIDESSTDQELLDEPEAPPFILPLLDDSDQLIRDGVVSLTRHEGINAWLAPPELIRKFVAIVDSVASGQVAKGPVRFLAPETPFLAISIGDDTYVLDPASFRRYDAVVEVIQSIDARRAAEFYQLVRPLFQKAYTELGYRDADFDDVMFDATGRLLETPVIEGVIRLRRPVVMFEYEDSRLENLSSVQKQLIRMGPRNTQILQSKIAEFAIELRSVLGR